MATYNGEKFLPQQLDSILDQSIIPDEIIISDDGSKDRTVEIAKQYAEKYKDRTSIVVLENNPRHGIGGNFSWAIGHATGDYIFICGQDDVWMKEKVQSVIRVFIEYPLCEMVCHDLVCIDSNGELIPNRKAVCTLRIIGEQGKAVHAERDIWTERAVSSPLVSGAVICISSIIAKRCLPIPCDSAEDQWLQFCAAADDQLYYLGETLMYYRIHESVSHSYGMAVRKRVQRAIARINNPAYELHDYISLSKSMKRYIEIIPDGLEVLKAAYSTANRLNYIGEKQIEAISSGRILGAVKLIRLYRSDMRYRRIGRNNFLYQLAGILLLSKTRRRKELGMEP